MIDVYAVNALENNNQELFYKLLGKVPFEKRKKIERFHRDADSKRCLMAEILVKTIVFKETGLDKRETIPDKNDYGKPYFNDLPDFHFNISHAGDWVVCAIHDHPVGIDIERIETIDTGIAERFFSRHENESLSQKCDAESLSYFYDLWTLKESYIKAIGKGLSIPLNSFSIEIHNNEIKLRSGEKLQNIYFKKYDFYKNYKLAVCGYSDDFGQSVNLYRLDCLCKEYLEI